MLAYANPARFMRLSGRLLPWLAGLTAGLLAVGFGFAVAVPPDYQQGETVLILFIHVPSAWMSLFVYTAMAAASLVALVWRHPLAAIAAREAAPLGAGFTALCLITGSLWGAPMWGAFWVWDARLTSELVLFFLYLGYLALARAFDDAERGGQAASILALVGWVNVPIIHFSVEWWNSLHQSASVFRLDGPTLAPIYLWPLLVLSIGFTSLFVALLMLRMRAALIERRIEALRFARADGRVAA